MKIILDVFGGDHAPLQPLLGAADAVKELGVEILAVGDIAKMEACCKENNIDTTGIEFRQADDVFDIHEDPMAIVKKRTDTSMHIALKALTAGEGDALVSAGSTGGLLMGATFIVKRLKGCKRPTLGAVVPGKHPEGFMLIDSGANNDVRPEMLEQFGVMGSVYMEKVMNRTPARVGLLNNGAEETKGPETHREAHALMVKNPHINFVGNIEGREVLNDHVDVLVADGFSGNIALKSVEGCASFMNKMMKDMFMTNLKTKIAAVLLKDQLKAFKRKMDYRYYGGGVIMGVNKAVIKAHGASDALAFKNAIRQAKLCAEFDVPGIIRDKLASVEEE
ncbi:MAG: phosphate acyltransferase PlsX [Oscillospiraceae bacterium]|nr:phosphate acyltransferase PlsX [Oscillospiraceae bacterium]